MQSTASAKRVLRIGLFLVRFGRDDGLAYKYYLTTWGRQVVTTSRKLKELLIIPNWRGEMRFA